MYYFNPKELSRDIQVSFSDTQNSPQRNLNLYSFPRQKKNVKKYVRLVKTETISRNKLQNFGHVFEKSPSCWIFFLQFNNDENWKHALLFFSWQNVTKYFCITLFERSGVNTKYKLDVHFSMIWLILLMFLVNFLLNHFNALFEEWNDWFKRVIKPKEKPQLLPFNHSSSHLRTCRGMFYC